MQQQKKHNLGARQYIGCSAVTLFAFNADDFIRCQIYDYLVCMKSLVSFIFSGLLDFLDACFIHGDALESVYSKQDAVWQQ